MAINNQTGYQKLLRVVENFTRLEKKSARVGERLTFVGMISRVNANGFCKITVVWTKPDLKNEKEQRNLSLQHHRE